MPEVDKYTYRTLAYIGDAYFELKIREFFLKYYPADCSELHNNVVKTVNGVTQHNFLYLMKENLFDEDEKSYVKKVRNNRYSGNNITKKEATAFEALLGRYYVEGNQKGLDKIIHFIYKNLL
ncbi:MAG: ribonuclease III domain-containing protein [Candidatus Muiribacteriota bacterium]